MRVIPHSQAKAIDLGSLNVFELIVSFFKLRARYLLKPILGQVTLKDDANRTRYWDADFWLWFYVSFIEAHQNLQKGYGDRCELVNYGEKTSSLCLRIIRDQEARKPQVYCKTAFTCEPLQANFLLWWGSVKRRQSVNTIFLPIFDTSVSTSTSSPTFITLRNSVFSEIEIVRWGLTLKILTVVNTSTIVASAPPWTVSCIFRWCGSKQ